MKAFVYDIGGYVGRALCDALSSGGAELVGCSVPPSGLASGVPSVMSDASALEQSVKSSDVVVCHLFGSLSDVQTIFTLCRKKTTATTFIAISTVLTWGRNRFVFSSPLPLLQSEEEPLQEERFLERESGPRETHIKTMESQILVAGTDKLSTYVLGCGLFYGRGEQHFDQMFKEAWLCLAEGVGIPAYCRAADNKIPTIHVSDMCEIVRAILLTKPEKHYLIAVDKGKYTLKEVVSSISEQFGVKSVHPWSDSDCDRRFLEDPWVGASFQMNLEFNTDILSIHELEFEWRCENGMIEGMGILMKEFIQFHNLFPQRIVLLGPPASGKSTLAKSLSEKYHLPIVTSLSAIQQAKQDADLSAEMQEALEGSKDKRYPVELMGKVLKHSLLQPECRNKGWVLDGFPRSYDEAKSLFGKGEDDEVVEDDPLPEANGSLVPRNVLVLDDEDKILQKRVLEMPSEQTETHNNEAGFKRRMKQFRQNHKGGKDATTFTFFEVSCRLSVQPLKASLPLEGILSSSLSFIESNGIPQNYHPTPEEVAAAQQLVQQAEESKLESESKCQEERETSERESRSSLEAEQSRVIESLLLNDERQLEERSRPLRTYLMENIIPTLTEGVLEVLRAKPADPVDYLAEWIFRHCPQE